jgi:hypothetical protein
MMSWDFARGAAKAAEKVEYEGQRLCAFRGFTAPREPKASKQWRFDG